MTRRLPKHAGRSRPYGPRPLRATEQRRAAAACADLVKARKDAEGAINKARAAHARLRDAIDILPQGIVFLDAEGRYILWNQQYADIYRRSADLFAPGAKLEDTLRIGVARGDYPAAIGREEEWLAERLDQLRNPRGRHEQVLSDGRCILIEERRTSEGGTIGLRVDITELKAREASFRLLFEANPIPMFVYGRADMAVLSANQAAADHYRYTRGQLQAMSLRDIHDPSEFAELDRYEGPATDRHAGRTWKHRRGDGSVIDVAIFSRELVHEGTPAVLIAAIDITERKRAEARVAYMAHHDALTGLPNRLQLRSRLEQALQRTAHGHAHLAALCIDLDDFKSVNDTQGHACGDLLLQKVTERLRVCLREEDVAARLGGDEFVVVLPDLARPEDAGSIAGRLIAGISEPYEINGQQVLIGASIGIALAPGDGADVDHLLRNADMALYRAKEDGKGSYRFFEREMDARLQARRRLEAELRRALAAGALDVHYQPILDLADGQVTGFEALARWPHPERGFISPGEFIPIAEETGLIVQLGEFILRRACADAATWPSHIKLAVNLSALQFRVGDVLSLVRKALHQTGLAPDRLEIEITETLMLEKSENVVATLHALRRMGVGIAMDDFGTGYSSLGYLRSFPFDKIKIDRSFVRDLAANRDSQAIVRAILSIGSSLGVTITAEGIESEAELAYLREQGCHQGQGYLLGKARPHTETPRLPDVPLSSEEAA